MKAQETVTCGDSIDATIQDSPNGVVQNLTGELRGSLVKIDPLQREGKSFSI